MADSTAGVVHNGTNGASKVVRPKKTAKHKTGFARWALARNEGGEWKRCFWHDAETGTREQTWDAQALPPSPGLIAERWGSGVYKLTKLDHKGKVAGSVALPAIDSPQHPPRPTYPNPPSAAKPEPAAPPPDPFASLMSSLAAPAQAQLASMLQGIQIYQQIDMTARQYAHQEAEARVKRAMAEMAQAQERDRQWFQLQMKQQRDYYDALSRARSDPNDELKEELEDLRERVESGDGDEDDGDPKSMLWKVLKRKLEDVPSDAIGDLISGLGENLKAGKKLAGGG